MAKISIIVPIYNVEKYLPKCLDSLVSQTYKDIEIWAINDGSSDNSDKIVKKYAKKDKRVKYFEKENGGYGSVLEFAINNITSEYFLICDPDDWLKDDAVETLYEKAEKNKLDILVGAKYLVYNDNHKEEYDDSKFYNCKVESDKLYFKTEQFYFLQPSPHSKLYRTKICKKIKFPKKVSFTDYLLYLLALSNAKRVMYLEKALSYYLVDRPGNSMTDTKPKVFEDHKKVILSILDQIKYHYNKSIYSRMFFQFRNVLIHLNKTGSVEIKKQFANDYIEILKKFIPYKKEILKSYPELCLKNKIYFYFLLNNKTYKYLFYRILQIK